MGETFKMRVELLHNKNTKEWFGCIKSNGEYIILETARSREELINKIKNSVGFKSMVWVSKE